jgi:hypothetical protein
MLDTFTFSATRLRHVQSLLNDGTKATKDYPDAILCIAGNFCSFFCILILLFKSYGILLNKIKGSPLPRGYGCQF